MFRHVRRGIFIGGLLFCVLFAGYYSGYSRGKEEGAQEALDRSAGCNKTIAIVNLDEGTGEQGERENYGIRLIDTITDDVVVTGLEDARRGIENGTYSAYLVIPAAFSRQVATIDAKPVKSEIIYAVGSGLQGKEREEVIYRVESIFRLFNDNLSKVYLSSILAAYHNAQDSASSILSNDREDMELLLQVRGEDLVEYIQTPQATIVENHIPDLDLSENYAENSRTVQEIYEAYQSFNAAGKEAVERIKQEFGRTAETVEELQAELISMEQTMDALADTPWDDSEQAAREDAYYQAHKEALTGALDGILTLYNASVREKQEDLLQAFLGKLRQGASLPAGDQEEAYIEEFLKNQASLGQVDTAAVDRELDALIQEARDSRTLRNEEIESRRSTWAEIRERMKTMQESYNEVIAANEETVTSMESFDIASFIDETKISGYLSQIEESLRGVEGKVGDQIGEYEEYVSRVYEAADNDIRSFEEEIARGQEQSEEKLFRGLEEAKHSRQENNENNFRLLNSLITQMPYTRVGEVENREVYDFIAEPILTDNQSETQKAPQDKETLRPETAVSVTAFAVLILLLGGAQILLWRRRMTERWGS